MKKKRLVPVMFSIFLVIGIIISVVGVVVTMTFTSFQSTADKITGEITQIEISRGGDDDIDYHVFVSYQYGGRDYENIELGYYSSGMYEGEKIDLLCDPENPGDVKSPFAGRVMGIVFGSCGIVFTLIGGIPLVIMLVKNRQNKKLLENGRVLHAVVESIEYNTNYRVNGRRPYVIFCSYRDDYQDITYRFKSKNLWTDPADVFPVGSNIDVYVMPDNFKKYYVKAEQVLNEKVVDLT